MSEICIHDSEFKKIYLCEDGTIHEEIIDYDLSELKENISPTKSTKYENLRD